MDSREKFKALRDVVRQAYQTHYIDWTDREDLIGFLREIEERWDMFEEENQ